MPTLTTPADLQIAIPNYPIDQIIGVTSGSFVIGAAPLGGDVTATQTFTTGFNDTCLFQGIYSVDSGTTWNDFGVYQPNLSTPNQPVLQTVTCQGYVTTGGVFTAVGKNWYDNVHSSSSSYTIQYKVFFIAKPGQGAITPITANQTLLYNSANNMQKVSTASSFAVSTSTATTITHNLGFVPKVRSWFAPTSATFGGDGIYQIPAGAMTTLDWFTDTVQVNTTQAIFSIVQDSGSGTSGIAGTMYYKIYEDS